MCQKIVINNGEKEIETPKEFKEVLGFPPMIDDDYNAIEGDCCLCQCDLRSTFMWHDIDFVFDGYDYYIKK
ncbi:hypothetical protein GO491_11705 [Flavobacteriaceae bacterium Ap0902]|nr:hypothetical protein [Flavobacteriaceae bacterium Ap0902]